VAGLGVAGGATHDGLIAPEAQAHRRTLLTFDERAVSAYERVGVRFTILTP
jgi:hypothetical protein